MPCSWEIRRNVPVPLNLIAHRLGEDLCFGGEAAHVGAVTLSIPRAHSHVRGRITSNTSVFSITGHKEDVLFREVGMLLAEKLNRTVVMSGGIHVEDASGELVKAIVRAVTEMTEELADLVERG